MIVGEAEIQGQVKRAYELALVEGATGPILNRLFRGALAAGGRARNETAIGERGVSIPSVAVEVAQRALGDLSERKVLMIGAGATAELVARALVARGVDTVFVANRHHDRALGLAERFDGEAIRFENLPEQLTEVDVVVSTTNSPHHIIERDGLEQVMAEREARPLLLIDIAVPRDIEPECREVAGVSVYDIDDVQQIVERNAGVREAEATRAERIIEDGARPLPAVARLARGGADDRGAARARRRGRAPGAGREREPLGEPLRGRPGADGTDGEGDRLADPARADPADPPRRRAPTTPTSTSARCASCSVSTSRPRSKSEADATAKVTELRRPGLRAEAWPCASQLAAVSLR